MTKPISDTVDAEPRRRVHVRGPGDLVDMAPYLLGFRPFDSLVVIALPAEGSQVCLTARADLAEVRRAGFAEYLAALVAQAGGRRALVVVYGATVAGPPGELPERDVVELFAEAAALVQVELLDALYVAGGRWWCYDPCGSPVCCPPAGTPVGGGGSRVAEEAEGAGLTALPDRAALAAEFDPVDAEQRGAVSTAVRVAEQELVQATVDGGGIGPWREDAFVLFRAVFNRIADGDVPWLGRRVAARLLVGLTDTLVRDLAWSWTNESPARCVVAGALWRQLARRAEEPYDAPPLFLAAWAAWRSGHGPMARVAVERALAADPGYSAALLLEQLIAQNYNPGTVGELLGPCPLDFASGGPRRRRGRLRRHAVEDPAASVVTGASG